jgi:hypothetical protein
MQLLLALASAVMFGSESLETRDHILLSQIRDFPFKKVQVRVMLRPTVQSASASWNKAPIWGLKPELYYCQTVAGLLMCGALSDERTGLSFARLRQQSLVTMYNLHVTNY